METIAITAGRSVGRHFQQFADFLECVLMPNLEDDDFSLVLREVRQGAHGLPFGLAFVRRCFKPTQRFELTGDPAPESAAIIEGTIPIGADAVMLGLSRRRLPVHQRHKRLLQNIFRFGVAQSKGPAIKEQLCPPDPVEGLKPCRLFAVNIHNLKG